MFQLAEALYQSVRMQLSVPLYRAIAVGRGANELELPEAAQLPVGVYLLLWRTQLGYALRAVGFAPAAAHYAGIGARFYF